MSLRQKIMLSVGGMLFGLLMLTGCHSLWMRIGGGIIALDCLILHWLWYRCPSCGKPWKWTAAWTYCPHCGVWIDYDAK